MFLCQLILTRGQEGICQCTKQCDGKGDGNGNGNCKKITIATFQSGNIIITGARCNKQTMDAYNFINRVLRTNYNEIVRISNSDNFPKLNQKIIVKSDNIINLYMREILLNKN